MTMNNADRNFMFDHFLDHCTRNGLDPDITDFDAYCDNIVDEAIDESLWG